MANLWKKAVDALGLRLCSVVPGQQVGGAPSVPPPSTGDVPVSAVPASSGSDCHPVMPASSNSSISSSVSSEVFHWEQLAVARRWGNVIEKVRRRLGSWFGPKGAARSIDELVRDSCGTKWDTIEHGLKLHTVCIPRSHGGLGIRKTVDVNKALF